MRLVHLTASTFFGGPERQMLELARSLPADWQATFVSFSEGGGCREFLERVGGQGFSGIALEHDTPRIWAACRELTQRLVQLKTDVLLCHGYKADIVGQWATRRAGIPVVAVSRGWTGESRRVRLYEAIDRIVLRWMDLVVCVSEAQAAKVRAAGVGPERVKVIANAIHGGRFAIPNSAARAELEQMLGGSCRRIVMAAGRLSPEKGFQVLVEAAAHIEDRSVGFLLFGEGALRQEIEQKIERHGLSDRFVLAGFRSDLDRLIPCVDLVVLPSFTEGMPNVALEALAAGVPVVATAVGGIPEVVDRACGRLVPSGNPAALADAIQDVLADDDVRRQMGHRGQDRIRRCFTFEAQAEQYVQLLDELVAKNETGTASRSAHSSMEVALGIREGSP